MDVNVNQIILPIILLSVCAGILLIESLQYLYVYYFTKGKLYLSILFLGFAGFIFVTSEIFVLSFGAMKLYYIGRYFHLLQAFTAALFLLFLPLFLYYFLDLNYYWKLLLKIIMTFSIIFLLILLFVIFYNQKLFLNFNKVFSTNIKPWNIARGTPGFFYLARDIFIGVISIFSFICLIVDLCWHKKYFYVLLPLFGAVLAISSGIIDLYFAFEERTFGLYSLRIFSFFCIGVTLFIILSMISVMKKFIDQTKQIEKAMKLKSLGVLAGGIAHDFNNILSTVIGNISLLKYDYKEDQNFFEQVIDIEKAISRAKGLTYQLLTFSKGNSPVKDIFLIKDLIKNTTLFVLSGSHIKVRFNFDKKLWNVNIDRDQISQVIQNIIINAKEAMHNGGILTINAYNHKVISNKGNIKQGKYVKIEIIDKGEGISKKNINNIFEPYYTTKEKGSGLGLFVCYSIIRNHDGYINASSDISKGTCFNIYLPAVEDQIQEKKEFKYNNIKIKGKVLILDDEKMILNLFKKILSTIGLETVCAKEGNEALQIFKENHKNKTSFDLVILDLTIKGGVGGKEIIKKIREINPNVKAIVSSGYSNDKVMSDYKKHGFDRAIKKPFLFEEIVEIIQDLMV